MEADTRDSPPFRVLMDGRASAVQAIAKTQRRRGQQNDCFGAGGYREPDSSRPSGYLSVHRRAGSTRSGELISMPKPSELACSR
jgi:hypothetical protein